MTNEAKLYKNFMKEYVETPVKKKISQNDFFKKDYINSLRIEKSFEILGQEIQIVVIPRGLRVSEWGFDGGMMAQPWFQKGDASRVLVHEEFMDFVKENPELQELNLQMISHEIGHMISMSDNFTSEFDGTNRDNIDPREIANLEAWIQRTGIGDLDTAHGATISGVLEKCKSNMDANIVLYLDLREILANYMAARFIGYHKKQEILFTVLQETVLDCSKVAILSMSDEVCQLLDISKDVFENDDLFEGVSSILVETHRKKMDNYISWISLESKKAPVMNF